MTCTGRLYKLSRDCWVAGLPKLEMAEEKLPAACATRFRGLIALGLSGLAGLLVPLFSRGQGFREIKPQAMPSAFCWHSSIRTRSVVPPHQPVDLSTSTSRTAHVSFRVVLFAEFQARWHSICTLCEVSDRDQKGINAGCPGGACAAAVPGGVVAAALAGAAGAGD
jgi:hypothetical protein